ncbi:MAG: homoserine kinase [Acidobacteria bacterium]|nr:MAG: homoserine kinase [Acidobacteriota bacterium]
MMWSDCLEGIEISVPGSIANLGPGLDTLAVAVQLYLRVRIVGVSNARRGKLEFYFESQTPPGENRIETSFFKLAQNNGDFPSLKISVSSDIPMGAGLGSSAAATIAGFRLYEVLFGKQNENRLLSAALQLEGHADNAAAALLGGLSVCCQKDDGSVSAFSLPWPESLCLVVLTPEVRLATQTSRQALPQSVSLKDAVANMQRVLLLLQSIQSGDDGDLAEALCDRLHQPARESIVPGLSAALKLSHPDLLGVFLGGSGPSIVALARQSCDDIADVLAETYRPLSIPFRTSTLSVHNQVSLPACAAISCS